MVQVAYERTKQLVEEKKDLIHIMAERLLAKEVLNLEDVELLFGPRPFATKNRTNIDRYRGITQEMRELENNKLLSPTGAISAEKKKGPPSQEGEGEGEGEGQATRWRPRCRRRRRCRLHRRCSRASRASRSLCLRGTLCTL